VSGASFDRIWEELYSSGSDVRYPYDQIVSFVYRRFPRHKPLDEIRILEIGCGTGNNLWFTAREGFQVYGVDASPSAIRKARQRFSRENLTGNFAVADFAALPFANGSFDLVLDRAAITCCGIGIAKRCVREVRRVLMPGGAFFFNPYSDTHGSRLLGKVLGDGLFTQFTGGPFAHCGQICFYSRANVENAFAEGWTILSMQHMECVENIGFEPSTHSEWRVHARKDDLE